MNGEKQNVGGVKINVPLYLCACMCVCSVFHLDEDQRAKHYKLSLLTLRE